MFKNIAFIYFIIWLNKNSQGTVGGVDLSKSWSAEG